MPSSNRFKTILLGSVIAAGIAATGAHAQEAPSSNATINLIRLLVKQGVISQKNADALVREAEQEANQAKAQQAVVAPAGAPAASGAAALPPPAAGSLRVPYVPEIVKNQIRDEVKKEVLAQARDENWAQPNAIPEWTKRIKIHGDFRFRDEADLFSTTNDPTIVNFAAFNANGPTDINLATNPAGVPILNTTQDRYNRLSIRARLGIDAIVTDNVSVGLRLASGGDNGPVSTTQLLGGGFGKKDFWLDQAYIKLEPSHWFGLTAGRMPNPFVHTDLVYDPDLNFDGVMMASETKLPWVNGINVFATEGAFPLGYVGGNFPDNSTTKLNEHQKWLWGSQIGFEGKGETYNWRFATSYYDFAGTQGSLSNPCYIYLGDKQCSSDASIPAYMQKGNTLFLTREIILDPHDPTNSAQPQFAGLAYKYKLVNATAEAAFSVADSYRLMFDLDFVHNTAYRAYAACRYAPIALPLNNVIPGSSGSVDPCDGAPATRGKFIGGPNGYYGAATFGDPQTRTPWAWNVSLGYKYLESDAVPDAYTDSDFHLGGTNARGFILGGSLGIFKDTWLTARWLSASEVSGSPMAIDVVQLDLNAGF